MEKIRDLPTRLASMSPGIFGLIIIALFAAGYRRSALMMVVLGSIIGMIMLLVTVVRSAIREEQAISVLKQTEAVGAGRRALDGRPKL